LKIQSDTAPDNDETLVSVQEDTNDEIKPTNLSISADDNNTDGSIDRKDNVDVKKNSNTVVGLLSIDSPYSLIREIFAS
jgi:hypothetical protein